MHLVTAACENGQRNQIEQFIRNRYAVSYGARLEQLAPHLVACVAGDRITCAAGLRTAADGFFCEVYLDLPAEKLIALRSGRSAARARLLEVTSLCSASPSVSIGFIRQIARYGLEHGFEWSIFVATARLHRLLATLSFEPVALARAQSERVVNRDAWGSYYDTDPVVMAVHRTSISRALPSLPAPVTLAKYECAGRACALFQSFAAGGAAPERSRSEA